MFDVRSLEAKNRIFKLDYENMNTFEFVQYSNSNIPVLDEYFGNSSKVPTY